MSKFLFAVSAVLMLSACNFVNIKPGTMEPDTHVFAWYGGKAFRHFIKQDMEQRGYTIDVGRSKSSQNVESDDDFNNGDFASDHSIGNVVLSDARYSIRVNERDPFFAPYWCLFNGIWWWRFSVSVTDRQTGAELLSWTGRGCANSTMRKFDRYMDRLEKKSVSSTPKDE